MIRPARVAIQPGRVECYTRLSKECHECNFFRSTERRNRVLLALPGDVVGSLLRGVSDGVCSMTSDDVTKIANIDLARKNARLDFFDDFSSGLSGRLESYQSL